MRKRYYLSFDLDDPRHQEAEALIANQGSRQRTECVVASILVAKQAGYVEQIVRKAVRDEMKRLQCLPPKTLSEETADAVRLTDLPDSLIHALDEI
jgi:hypothetical protein